MAEGWSNSQSQSDKEAVSEANAELQVLFPLIRSFFYGSSQHMDAVRAHCGAFPASWQECQSWSHFKDLRKRYLAFTDGVVLGPPTSSSSTPDASASTPEEAPAEGTSTPSGDSPSPANFVTVSNLDHTASANMLTQVFSCFGGLDRLVLVSGGEGTRAVIRFETPEAASQALALDGMTLGSTSLAVTLGGVELMTKTENSEQNGDASGNPTGNPTIPTAVPAAASAAAAAESAAAARSERKRSRWGADAVPTDEESSATGASATEGAAATTAAAAGPGVVAGSERKRRNRWASSAGAGGLQPVGAGAGGELAVVEGVGVGSGHAVLAAAHNPVMVALGLSKTLTQEEEQEAVVLRMQVAQAERALLPHQLAIDAQALDDAAPMYDAATGLRTNTKDLRMKDRRLFERAALIERLCLLDPMYRPPPDYVRKKPSAKLYIPYKEYPTYNFIGLVIGPRGNTQKAMERETNCKISIRGKGSVKEGSRGRNDGKYQDENDEMHVLVQGETQKAVDAGVELVKPLLVPVDDDANSHKQDQLRELALINGTLKDEDFCPLCGLQGHRQFACPTASASQSYAAANVRCANCGETSHPTRDCPLAKAGGGAAGGGAGAAGAGGAAGGGDAAAANGVNKNAALDQEYLSFMDELSGAPPKQLATAATAGVADPATAATAGTPAAAGTAAGASEAAAPVAAGETAAAGDAAATATLGSAPPAALTANGAPNAAPPPGVMPPGVPPPGVLPPGVPPLPAAPASLAPLVAANDAEGLRAFKPTTPEEADFLAHYFAHQHMQQAMYAQYQQQQQQQAQAAYYYQQQQQQQQQQYGGYAGYYQPQGYYQQHQYGGQQYQYPAAAAPAAWPAQQQQPQQGQQEQYGHPAATPAETTTEATAETADVPIEITPTGSA